MFLTNLVRRAALWSLSLFMFVAPVAALTSLLWLFTPLAREDWFICTHRVFLALALFSFIVLFILIFAVHRFVTPAHNFAFEPLERARVHVGLTAYNEEQVIAQAVREFKECRDVHKVIVADNNSKDATKKLAIEAGADEVITETVPGYGSCCMRALSEAAKGADVIILCEGDLTFTGRDVRKLLAYLENCDLVLGTRATQELRDAHTQMDWLINPFNQLVAKMVQTRFWGTRLTDMGCTFRAIRADAYARLAPKLTVTGGHFSPHMFIEALKMNMRVIEVPVTFRERLGESKVVGNNKYKAAKVALRMLRLLYSA